MGIDYIILNLDKQELLDFDQLGFGTKIGAITSEPIAKFLGWLLVNPEGYGDDPPEMFGRWAGHRIEIVGDEGTGYDRQEEARKKFKDITIETIRAFAATNPFERITILQPMGLIDKDGKVVLDPRTRDLVRQYWKELDEMDQEELYRYLAEQERASSTTPAKSPTSPETPPSD